MQKAQKTRSLKDVTKEKQNISKEEAIKATLEVSSSSHHHKSCTTLLEISRSVIARA
jgi:hypothetical protein